VEAGVAFPADAEPPEVVQPGERALHNPAHAAESGAVLGTAAGDHWFDASEPQLAAVLIVVVAAIGDHPVGALARPAAFARDGADPVDQWEQLRDVIAMATGQRCGQRHAVMVDDQVVLGTSAGAVDWRTAGQWTSAKRADVAGVYDPGRQSSSPRALSRVSISRCSRSHTPAACQSRSRRHAVTPEQPIS
jgi:hypothetical protein